MFPTLTLLPENCAALRDSIVESTFQTCTRRRLPRAIGSEVSARGGVRLSRKPFSDLWLRLCGACETRDSRSLASWSHRSAFLNWRYSSRQESWTRFMQLRDCPRSTFSKPNPTSLAEASSGRHLKVLTEFSLRGARIALDGETSINSDIEICDGRVRTIASSSRVQNGPAATVSAHLHGYLLLPGLINAHDHLEFGLYPNLGRGPYRNASEWARDIQEHEGAIIDAHQSVPHDVRLWWGALRNLLCGVTTVCHHNPLHPELLLADFPIRVVTNYGWAHSLSMDSDVRAKFTATPDNQPFIVHACEGVDEASVDEVFELDRLHALGERSVLVHGLAISAAGIALLNARNATLVWCPSSNRYLFGRTHGSKTIASIRRVLLGSDSPLTAAGDLLDEIQIAHREAGVSARDLYRMLFLRAAQVFRLQDGQGSIRTDGVADVVGVREKGLSPAETVANLGASDVELVIVGGRVQLASEEIFRRLPPELTQELRPLEIASCLRWVKAPLGRLFSEAQKALGSEVKLGGKRIRHVCSVWF